MIDFSKEIKEINKQIDALKNNADDVADSVFDTLNDMKKGFEKKLQSIQMENELKGKLESMVEIDRIIIKDKEQELSHLVSEFAIIRDGLQDSFDGKTRKKVDKGLEKGILTSQNLVGDFYDVQKSCKVKFF